MTAATHRFAAHGFAGTSTASIAEDAGVAEGTLYLHFGTKAGLLVAVMNDYYDRLAIEIDEVATGPGTAQQRLHRLVDHWLAASERDWALTSIFRQQGRFRGDERIVTAFAENNRHITRMIGGVIDELKLAGSVRDDVPTRLLRDMILGTIEHVQLGRLESGRPRSIERIGRELLDVLMNGAAEPRGRAWTVGDLSRR